MSTRSRIGVIRTKDERGEPSTVESIYCHFDGYPEGVGAVLVEHWSDHAKLDALLALGDISALGSEIGEAHNFDTADDDVHSGTVPESWTLAYGRDRGESDVGSVTHDYNDWPDYGQEYDYLLTSAGWVYRTSEYGQPSGDPWHVLDDSTLAVTH